MKFSNKCHSCKYKRSIPGDAHISCSKKNVVVKGNDTGIRNGWFFHPINFDPTWLEYCIGFQDKDSKLEEKTNKELQTLIANQTYVLQVNENLSDYVKQQILENGFLSKAEELKKGEDRDLLLKTAIFLAKL